MVVTGVYGEPLLKQHGSPVRIIVPWKYGYKNPKSIVKIEFVAKSRRRSGRFSLMSTAFSRTSTPTSRIPAGARPIRTGCTIVRSSTTPIFNGYEEYVAELYPDEPRKPQQALKQGQVAR